MTALLLAPDYDRLVTHQPDAGGLQPICSVRGFGLTADCPVTCWECRALAAPGHRLDVPRHEAPVLIDGELVYRHWYVWICECGTESVAGSRWSHTDLALESGRAHTRGAAA